MGLDMYLTAKLQTYKSYGKEKEHPIRKIVRKNLKEIFSSGNIEYIGISFEAGYWRKANEIHQWFVDNCQEGKDNCQNSYVSREDLKKLLKICNSILKDKKLAKSLLPTQSGFFFGNTKYDKWYFEDIKRTIKIIEKCLNLSDEWEFEYHSSW